MTEYRAFFSNVGPCSNDNESFWLYSYFANEDAAVEWFMGVFEIEKVATFAKLIRHCDDGTEDLIMSYNANEEDEFVYWG